MSTFEKKFVPVSLTEVLQDMNDTRVPIGKLAHKAFGTVLQHERCPDFILTNLQSLQYCRAHFKAYQPVLVRIRKYENRPRYYDDFLRCHDEYYCLHSMWFNHQRKELVRWLRPLVRALMKYEDKVMGKSHAASSNCTMLCKRFRVKKDESTRCLILLNKEELQAAANNGVPCVFVLQKGNIRYECRIEAQVLESVLLCHSNSVTDKGNFKNWAFRLSFSNGSIATAYGLPAKEIGRTIASGAKTV